MINGGTFTCGANRGMFTRNKFSVGGAELTINGGEFNGSFDALAEKVFGKNTDGVPYLKCNVNGGKYDRVLKASLMEDGYVVIPEGKVLRQDEDTYWTLHNEKLTLEPVSHDFGSRPRGYGAIEAKSFNLSNDMGIDATVKSIAGATNYDVSFVQDGQSLELPFILSDGVAGSILVKPKNGLGVGGYDETLTITYRDGGDEGSADKTLTVGLSFTVTESTTPPGNGGGEDPEDIEEPEDPGNTDDPEEDPPFVEPREEESDKPGEAEFNQAITDRDNDGDLAGSTFGHLKARGVAKGKKKVQLKWTDPKLGAVKFIVYGNQCNAKGKKYTYKRIKAYNAKTFKCTMSKIHGKKLKKGTYYKFIVAAVDRDGKVVAVSKTVHVTTNGGKKGNDKAVKRVKPTKKSKYTIGAGKPLTLKVKEVKGKKPVARHRAVAWESSDKTVAAVKNGKVIARKAGTCTIYAYAQNGVYTTFRVIVR